MLLLLLTHADVSQLDSAGLSENGSSSVIYVGICRCCSDEQSLPLTILYVLSLTKMMLLSMYLVAFLMINRPGSATTIMVKE